MRSPAWSAYDGIDEEEEFADLISPEASASVDSGTSDPLATTLNRRMKKLRVLARGAQGVVYLAAFRDDPLENPVAVKRIFANDGGCYSAAQNTMVTLQREIDLLCRFRADGYDKSFPHVVRLLEVLHAPSREKCAVLEYCPTHLGVLGIRKQKRTRESHSGSEHHHHHHLSLAAIRHVLREVCLAVAELHRADVVHRDIKLSNFLVTGAGEIRLADFGSARELRDASREGGEDSGRITPSSFRTTLVCRAPEALLGPVAADGAAKLDMWGVGVVFAELLRGKHLFSAHSELAMISQLFSLVGTPTEESWPGYRSLPVFQSFEFQPCGSVLREKFERSAGCDGYDLLSKLLASNPEARPSAADALTHPFLNSHEGREEAAAEWKAFVASAITVDGESKRTPMRGAAVQLLAQLQRYGDGSSDEENGDDDDDIEDPF